MKGHFYSYDEDLISLSVFEKSDEVFQLIQIKFQGEHTFQ